MLISFPPLSNMLKSSGSSYLISGANKTKSSSDSSQIHVIAALSIYFMSDIHSHLVVNLVVHTETSMPILVGASCVQKSDDS